MDEKELLLKEITDNVKQILSDSQKDNIKKTELDSAIADLNKSIEKLDNEGKAELKEIVDNLTAKNKELEEALIKQSDEITKLKDSGTNSGKISFREAVKNAILEKKDIVLTEKNDDFGKRLSLKEYFTEKGNKTTPTFTIKTAVDMLESNIVQSNVSTVRLTELDPQRVGIPLTIYPNVINWMPSKNIMKPYMSILVVYSYTDGSATKTEGSASGKSSFLFKTVEFKAFYLATYFTLSDETLDDLDEAMDEISITAPSKVLDLIDTKILGTSGDDSSDIAGLFTANKHTDFDTTTYANTQENANIIDLISKSKLQCEGNKYMPDAVIMNPSDVEKLSGLKDALDNSIMDRRVRFDNIGNPAFVKGLRIITSTAITADTLAVVDSKQLMIGKRKDMTMEIGYNGTDLTEGQKTVVIKVRVAFGVRDKAAVIYSDSVTDDIDIINIANN